MVRRSVVTIFMGIFSKERGRSRLKTPCPPFVGVLLCLDCSATHRSMGVHTTFVRSVDLDEWTQRQIDAMRLGGNDNARQYFRKHGQTDMHGKIEKKYTSKIAKAYKAELLSLVSGEASKRGEAGATTQTTTEATPNLLLSNLEISSQAEQDALAREKIAQARAAHAQPVQASAKMASQLPGASKLVTSTIGNGATNKSGQSTNGNSASTTSSSAPMLRKPASSAGSTKLFLKKKPSGTLGSSKLRVNKLVTPAANNTVSGLDATSDFDDFGTSDTQQQEEEAAVVEEAKKKKAQEEEAARAELQRQQEAAASAVSAAAEKQPAPSSMEQGVAKLKAMNSDFFANM